jgi:hypothetical protein
MISEISNICVTKTKGHTEVKLTPLEGKLKKKWLQNPGEVT